nr:MAG: capsid protein [Longfin eel hepevirus]
MNNSNSKPKTQRPPRRRNSKRPGGSKSSPASPAISNSKLHDQKQDRQLAALKKELTRDVPAVKETFHTVINLGVTSGSSKDAVLRSATAFLNPALLRDKGGVSGPTPLSTKAGQYSLYRIKKAELNAYAMVGSSGVGGTLLIATTALDAGQPSPIDFDVITARHHSKIGVGRDLKYPLNSKSFAGPKGTFYYLNPSDKQGNSSLGPRLEVFVYGATTNIYTNQPFEGVLWRLTLSVTYEFANYTPNPTLVDLHIETNDKTVTIQSSPEGEVVLSTEGTLLTGKLANVENPLGDAVFSLLDSGANVLANVPVLGPLLQTGLAFLKPIFGASAQHLTRGFANSELTHHYLLCHSFDAAMASNPITVPVPVPPTVLVGEVVIQQLTPLEAHQLVDAPVYPLPITTRMAELPRSVFSWTMPAWCKNSVQFGTSLAIGMKDGTTAQLSGTSSLWVLIFVNEGIANGSAALLPHLPADVGKSVYGDQWSLLNSVPNPPRSWGGFRAGKTTTPPLSSLAGREFSVTRVHANEWGTAPLTSASGYLFIDPQGRNVFAVMAFKSKPGDGRAHFYTIDAWV